jgi:cytochrome c peroxidase
MGRKLGPFAPAPETATGAFFEGMMKRTFLFLICTISCFGGARAWETLAVSPPIPQDNPQTGDKIELGKQLFFDPRFSSTGTVSCNSCHNLML